MATFKSVDTCAAEFEAYTPYYYSTYEDEDETPPSAAASKRIMILGGGPNRIGQGIEFDYCCCHASFALHELGIESIMVNSNPETVSTDYDTCDLLFFEPLTTEDVLNICDRVQPDGVIVQFGGQTPLNLARALSTRGVPIIGTSADTIEVAEDREKFQRLLDRLRLQQPANGIARTMARRASRRRRSAIPVLVRPSFVLGGRAMEICYDDSPVRALRGRGVHRRPGPAGADRQIPGGRHRSRRRRRLRRQQTDRRRRDGAHRRGRHPLGRLGLRLPPYSLPGQVVAEIRKHLRAWPSAEVNGLMNIQFAVKKEDDRPTLRARSQSARQPHGPLRVQGHGLPLAKMAAKIMAGVSLAEQGYDANRFPATSRSRRACSRSSSSRASTSCWGPRCVRPAK